MRSINRRRFLHVAGAGALAAQTNVSAAPAKPARALMKVGCQRGPSSDEMLQYFAQFGVKNICGHVPQKDYTKPWTVDAIEAIKKRATAFGVTIDMLALPLSSAYITK